MVSPIIIPIIVVSIVGLIGYLVYRYVVVDMSSKRAVQRTLRRYDIDKTPSQIIREYYTIKGKPLSNREIRGIEKECLRNEPDQFLAMYDVIREKSAQNGANDDDA